MSQFTKDLAEMMVGELRRKSELEEFRRRAEAAEKRADELAKRLALSRGFLEQAWHYLDDLTDDRPRAAPEPKRLIPKETPNDSSS